MNKLVRGLLWTAGILAVVVLGLRAFVMKAWTVPADDPQLSASIVPTLQAGDVVLVLTRGKPGFGDLVRCPDPEDPTSWVIGRILGLAGDTVETEGAQLWVDGKPYRPEAACEKKDVTIEQPGSGIEVNLVCKVVSAGGGWHYTASDPKAPKRPHTKTEVGAGKVFLLSDDRDYHDDSRDFGTVPADSCKETIFFRLWSKTGWSDTQARLTYLH